MQNVFKSPSGVVNACVALLSWGTLFCLIGLRILPRTVMNAIEVWEQKPELALVVLYLTVFVYGCGVLSFSIAVGLFRGHSWSWFHAILFSSSLHFVAWHFKSHSLSSAVVLLSSLTFTVGPLFLKSSRSFLKVPGVDAGQFMWWGSIYILSAVVPFCLSHLVTGRVPRFL